jgi:RNA polymerase sigma-70 factor (ECF subfamily)
VAQARLGDARAISLLYRRYLNQVYDFTAHRLPSREAAEDATQAIFLKAFSSLHTCRDANRFAGWLFAIARNVITDSYRSGRVVHLTLDDAPDLADPNPSPETLALRSEWFRELARLREDCLKEADRDLLDLRLQGLSDREIATALHRSHGAIRVAQHRMVQRLRDCLGLTSREREATHVEV